MFATMLVVIQLVVSVVVGLYFFRQLRQLSLIHISEPTRH